MIRKLGPIQLELINNDITSFYRFFYRKNDNNNDVYKIQLDNIVMNRLDLDTRTFVLYSGLKEYLDEINNNTTNVSAGDLIQVRTGIRSFIESENSCLEIILPLSDGKNYSQNDINEIYNTAVIALGI